MSWTGFYKNELDGSRINVLWELILAGPNLLLFPTITWKRPKYPNWHTPFLTTLSFFLPSFSLSLSSLPPKALSSTPYFFFMFDIPTESWFWCAISTTESRFHFFGFFGNPKEIQFCCVTNSVMQSYFRCIMGVGEKCTIKVRFHYTIYNLIIVSLYIFFHSHLYNKIMILFCII